MTASTPLRWGILGTGGIAHRQVSDLIKYGFTVSAVGSRSAESAEAFATEFGIDTAHASYESLVADAEVDIIYVATPHPFHFENALLALDASKHVLVEKTFTINAGQAAMVVDAAAKRNLVVMEAMWTRFLPHMVRIREIIAEGTIGDVRTVFADHNQRLPTDPAHRINNPELGGGALLDLGIYPVSLAFDLLGQPTTIVATSSRTATGVDRQTAIVLGYPDGQQAVLQCALDTAGPNRATILGTAGYIDIENVWYAPTGFTVYDADRTVIEKYANTVKQHGMQYQAWEIERRIRANNSAVGADPRDILPPSESVEIMRALDLIRAQIGLVYPGE